MSAGKTARACVLEKLGQFGIREYPVPTPAPGTVLLEMELCGVCGTDLHYFRASLPAERYPLLLGHENAGRIVALGEGVATDALGEPVSIGDRVVPMGGAPAGIPCGRCYFCSVVGTPSKCIGGTPPKNADVPPHLTGGFSQLLYLPVPFARFFKTQLPARTAVLLEPLTTTIHAVDRARVKIGDTVVIQGVGAMGLMQLAAATKSGATQTIVVGAPKRRLELAKEFGANHVIDIEEVADPQDRTRLVREYTPRGLGADIVFECAGVPSAINEGISFLRDSGTLVEVGHFIDTGRQVTLNPASEMVRRNLNIVAPFASSVEHYARGLTLLERGLFPFGEMVSHVVGLDRVPDAIDALGSNYRLDGAEVIKIVIAPNQ